MSLSIGLKLPPLDATPEAFRELGGWCADWWSGEHYYKRPMRRHIAGLYEWLDEPQPKITKVLWLAFVAGWNERRESEATK